MNTRLTHGDESDVYNLEVRNRAYAELVGQTYEDFEIWLNLGRGPRNGSCSYAREGFSLDIRDQDRASNRFFLAKERGLTLAQSIMKTQRALDHDK